MTYVDEDGKIRSRSAHYNLADIRNREADAKRRTEDQGMNKQEINEKVSPIASFCRGGMFAACALQGLQLVTPDVLQVWEWPIWARAISGVVFLLLAVNYLMIQRGLMIAQRIAVK